MEGDTKYVQDKVGDVSMSVNIWKEQVKRD